MKLHALLLIAWLGAAVLCALAGQYVPAAITFAGYVLYTVLRDAAGWHPRTGWRTRTSIRHSVYRRPRNVIRHMSRDQAEIERGHPIN